VPSVLCGRSSFGFESHLLRQRPSGSETASPNLVILPGKTQRICRLASTRAAPKSRCFARDPRRVSGASDARSAQLPVCVLIRPWVFLVHPVNDQRTPFASFSNAGAPITGMKSADSRRALAHPRREIRLELLRSALHQVRMILVLAIEGRCDALAFAHEDAGILGRVIEFFEAKAPLSALQLRDALDTPLGSAPPDGRTRLKIVQGEDGGRAAPIS
jgi:hypothetical protein